MHRICLSTESSGNVNLHVASTKPRATLVALMSRSLSLRGSMSGIGPSTASRRLCRSGSSSSSSQTDTRVEYQDG
jgi:hypothetical protein